MAKARKSPKRLKDLKGKGKTVSKQDAKAVRGGLGGSRSIDTIKGASWK